MTESGQEFSGRTVEEAIEDGLNALGLSQGDVEVEVVSKGSRGILGFGSEPALVRLTPRTAAAVSPDATAPETLDRPTPVEDGVEDGVEDDVEDEDLSPSMADGDVMAGAALAQDETVDTDAVAETVQAAAAEEAQPQAIAGGVASKKETDEDGSQEIDDDALAVMASELLTQLITLMDFEATVDASWQDADETTGSPYLLLDIRGDDLGALIGRRGETLASIQYLLRLMVNQQVRQWKNIVVDVEHYKERRVAQLAQLADRMARQVAETGRSVMLEPMPGNERRIIHMTLRDHPDVFTESTGEGERRKVNIFPQR